MSYESEPSRWKTAQEVEAWGEDVGGTIAESVGAVALWVVLCVVVVFLLGFTQ